MDNSETYAAERLSSHPQLWFLTLQQQTRHQARVIPAYPIFVAINGVFIINQ